MGMAPGIGLDPRVGAEQRKKAVALEAYGDLAGAERLGHDGPSRSGARVRLAQRAPGPRSWTVLAGQVRAAQKA